MTAQETKKMIGALTKMSADFAHRLEGLNCFLEAFPSMKGPSWDMIEKWEEYCGALELVIDTLKEA